MNNDIYYYRHINSSAVRQQAIKVENTCKQNGIMTVAEQSRKSDELYKKVEIMTVAEQSRIVNEMYNKINKRK